VETLELVLKFAECAEDFFAVLLENLDPHRGVACGDAGGVAQTAAGGVAPGRIFLSEKTAECRCECLRKMADVGNDFVVFLGSDGGNGGAECAPELGNGFGCCGRRVCERCDETIATVKERFRAVFPAGFRAAGHRVGADKGDAGGHGGGALVAEFGFDAAHVGDDGTGGQMRADLAGEFDDFFNGCGEDDEAGGAHGFLGRIENLVTPGLVAQLLADFGAARPDDDAPGETAYVGGLGDGTAKQAGSENRQLFEHRDCKREWRENVEFFGGGFVGEADGAKLVCQESHSRMLWRSMDLTDEEKKKARRAILILYTCMIVGIGLPIILYFALR